MKTQRRIIKSKQSKADCKATQDIPSESIPTHVTRLEVPPPDYLLHEAKKEPDRKLLEEYGEVIRLLRDDKHLSFREIAEWLKEYGFGVDHNAVYREYTRGLSDEDAEQVARDEALEEQQ